MRCECTHTPGPVGRQCQGQLIEGELIMPQLSVCCSLIAGLLCASLISNSSVWPRSAALLLSCHTLSFTLSPPLCVCVCVCEALDAPSPRLCVCSHGQQGVNPLLSLLSHSWSLGGILVLHLSLLGFILIRSTPDLPKKKDLCKSATYRIPPPKRHLQKNNPEVMLRHPTDVTPRGAAHQGATDLLPNHLLLLQSQLLSLHVTSVNPPYLCFCCAIH